MTLGLAPLYGGEQCSPLRVWFRREAVNKTMGTGMVVRLSSGAHRAPYNPAASGNNKPKGDEKAVNKKTTVVKTTTQNKTDKKTVKKS